MGLNRFIECLKHRCWHQLPLIIACFDIHKFLFECLDNVIRDGFDAFATANIFRAVGARSVSLAKRDFTVARIFLFVNHVDVNVIALPYLIVANFDYCWLVIVFVLDMKVFILLMLLSEPTSFMLAQVLLMMMIRIWALSQAFEVSTSSRQPNILLERILSLGLNEVPNIVGSTLHRVFRVRYDVRVVRIWIEIDKNDAFCCLQSLFLFLRLHLWFYILIDLPLSLLLDLPPGLIICKSLSSFHPLSWLLGFLLCNITLLLLLLDLFLLLPYLPLFMDVSGQVTFWLSQNILQRVQHLRCFLARWGFYLIRMDEIDELVWLQH